ncbi:MAG: two-component regulator propeller domain-containing protein, partial [Calditrichaceae bacterium]
MLTDSHGNYWAAHYPGLIKYNPESDKLSIFQPEKGNRNSLLNNNINSLYEDSSGVIFIGTKESGLHRYDPDRDAIIQLPEKNGKYKYLQAPQSGGSLYIATGSVFAIQQISDGTFWINSFNGGLKVYNPDLTKSMLYLPDGNKNLALNFITSIFEDNQKNIWLNTVSKGILKVRASKSLFTLAGKGFNELEKLHLNNIRGIYESRDKSLWIGTANGTLVNYNPATNKAKIFKTGSLYGHPGSQLTGSDYEAFYEDKDGFIWIASFNGIIKYNPQNNHFEKVYYKMNGKLSESRIDVEGFVPDNNEDYLWIAGWGFGLIKLNLKTLETQIFKSSADSTGLLSNNIFTISKSRSGDILICTEYGLSIYEQSKNQFKNYPLGSRFNSVYEDSAGILWTGSVEGLFKIDRKKNTVKHFTTTDGLPSNMIAGILGDDKYLWIGTGRGLVRFNGADESILTFNETDGAQLDLFEIANSYYKTRDGLFLFGGTDGITAFNPSKIKMNIYPPNVLITDMKIYDKSENKYFTKRNWDNGKVNTVEFPYFQNEIEFNYVGLHYKRPERNKYKYRLEPYDKIWKDAGTQRIARYTSLDPGDHTFQVMACNSDGIWNPKPATLHIVILPPWWKTWWAYMLYVLFGFGLLLSIRQFELKRRRENEENKRKTKELEEARQLQLSMLPKELPQLPHLDIAVYMQTATEVGGDYYDFHVALDGTLT